MPWLTRGLRDGVVTTEYPRRPDGYDDTFRSAVSVRPSAPALASPDAAVNLCPTRAITFDRGELAVDASTCILCGRCVEQFPDVFAFDADIAVATYHLNRDAALTPSSTETLVANARGESLRRGRALRRSMFVRHVDGGSDGAEEWEIAALTNPIYDVQRLGIFFTASPKHADILLVTGLGTSGMIQPILETYVQMPEPKIVVLAGVDALSGGLVGSNYTSHGGLLSTLPVDVLVPGSPPSPFALLHGLLLATGLVTVRDESTR